MLRLVESWDQGWEPIEGVCVELELLENILERKGAGSDTTEETPGTTTTQSTDIEPRGRVVGASG